MTKKETFFSKCFAVSENVCTFALAFEKSSITQSI